MMYFTRTEIIFIVVALTLIIVGGLMIGAWDDMSIRGRD